MTGSRKIRIFDDRVYLEQDRSSRVVLIQQGDRVSGQVEVQVLDRTSGKDALPEGGKLVPIDAVYGIYQLLSGPFLALVIESEARLTGFGNVDIHKASRVAIIPIFAQGRRLNSVQQRDEDRYLELLHMAFSQHQFYYSHTYDVTLSLQKIATSSAQERSKHLWQRANQRYFWNREVVEVLAQAQAHEWITPFMSAYVEARSGQVVAGKAFTLLFVSRRSRFRQGCRFTMRGAEESGDVANFVETEQALLFDDGAVASFVQLRGSIPLYWSSPVTMKYAPKVLIEPSVDRNRLVFQRHMKLLLREYKRVLVVNLIDKKKDQGRLGKAFKEASDFFSIQGQGSSGAAGGGRGLPVDFLWFDFHKECAKMKWHNLSKVFDLRGEELDTHHWFQAKADGTITKLQVGVTRTNCMDNLDRTNVVQSMLARRTLVRSLEAAGAPPDVCAGAMANVLETGFGEFEKVYKDVWGNNADAMSLLYSGTGALKTDFTRTGKRTFVGLLNDGWNSTMRYYINNFLDGARQDSIDLMLGRFVPSIDAPTPFSPRAGQETITSFVTWIVVLCVLIFSCLIITGPRDTPLQTYLGVSLGVTWLLFCYVMFGMVKKEHAMGKRLVVHPKLCPEPPIIPGS